LGGRSRSVVPVGAVGPWTAAAHHPDDAVELVGPQRRADAGDELAANWLAELLACRGDEARL
jgi:hypothetical protein